jgi:hypothetical protein
MHSVVVFTSYIIADQVYQMHYGLSAQTISPDKIDVVIHFEHVSTVAKYPLPSQ